MEKRKIINSLLYSQDIVTYLKKYIEIMDSYYQNLDNRLKDEFSYGEYEELKKECEKKARERGLL